MKRLFILLSFTVGMSLASVAQKQPADSILKATFQAVVSHDLMEDMGFLGYIMTLDASPNPLESLKGKQVKIGLAYDSDENGILSGQFHVYDGNQEVLGFGLTKTLVWDVEDQRLVTSATGYNLQVMPLVAQPYIRVVKYNARGDAEHMWEFKPTTGTSRHWLSILLAASYQQMLQLKTLAGGLSSGKQWAERLSDLERHFPKLQLPSDDIKPQKAPARQLSESQHSDAASQRDANALLLFTIGQGYHNTQKNDREAYRWLMKAWMAAKNADRKTIRDYILTNLPRRRDNPILYEDFTTLRDTTITPLQLALHPLATLPTAAAFDKGKKIAADLQLQRQWTFGTFNKKSITIYGNDRSSHLPTLYGQKPSYIQWSNYDNLPSYEYSFDFDSLEQAEQFALQFAYDLYQEGFDFTSSSGGSRDDGTFTIDAFGKFFVNKKYYQLLVRVNCLQNSRGKWSSLKFFLLKNPR